jgi:hypothetical protein
MRDRHLSRLCRSCQAPMACQADACWRCGAPSAGTATASPRLRVLTGTASPTRDDADRWIDEGGSVPSEAAAGRRVTANRR